MMFDKNFKVIVHGEDFTIPVCHEWLVDMVYRDVDAVEEIAEAFIKDYYFEYPTPRAEAKASVKSQIEREVLEHIEYIKRQKFNRKGIKSWLNRLLNIS